MKLLNILVILMLTQEGFQQCTKGCIQCKSKSSTDSTKVCVLCDTLANYYFSGDKCLLSDVTNCRLLLHDNSCMNCNKGYYVNNKKCVAVDTTKVVANCEDYKADQTCGTCEKDFVLETNKCNAVTSKISNCMYYEKKDTKVVCSICSMTHYPAENQESCIALKGNCSSYSRHQCKECAEGYLMNQNLFKVMAYDFSTSLGKNMVSFMLFKQREKMTFIETYNICQPIIVTNCAKVKDFQTCETCAPGFYLKNGQCVEYPKEIIQNCLKYEAKNNASGYGCIQCSPNFYLDNVQCKPSTTVTNCQTYSLNQNACLTCVTTHFLNNSACDLRTKTVSGCSTYVNNADKCSSCVPAQVMSSDGLKCLNAIAQCATHNGFTMDKIQADLGCGGCNAGFYLAADNKSCTQGTVTNCALYQTSANTCTKCNNQFYPIPTCDKKHADIANCKLYNETDEKYCKECNNDYEFFNIKVQTNCVVNKIDNCLTYNNDNSSSRVCSECEDTHWLNGQTCALKILNCQTQTAVNVCQTCKAGWRVDGTGCSAVTLQGCAESQNNVLCTKMREDRFKLNSTAVPLSDVMKQNCYERYQPSDFGTSATMKYCLTCDTQSFFAFNLPNYCIKKTDWETNTTYTAKANCKRHDEGNNCLECDKDYYLGTDGMCSLTACTDAQTYVYLNKQSTGEIKHNYCITSAGNTGHINVKTKAFLNGRHYNFECKSSQFTLTLAEDTGNQGYKHNFELNTTTKLLESKLFYSDYVVKCSEVTFVVNTQIINGTAVASTTPTIPEGIYTNSSNNYNKIGCYKSKVGNVGIQGAGNSAIYFIDACSTNSAFTNMYSGELFESFRKYHNYFSVNKCTDNTPKLLTILMTQSTDGGDYTYSKYNKEAAAGSPAALDTGTDVLPFACLRVDTFANLKADIGITNLAFTGASLDLTSLGNCAMAIYNLYVNVGAFTFGIDAATSDSQNVSLVCVACKPGYNLVGGACAAIANCDMNATQNVLNKCQKCNTTHFLSETGEACHAVGAFSQFTNCLMGRITDQKPICSLCVSGYYLNKGGFCSQLSLSANVTFKQEANWSDVGTAEAVPAVQMQSLVGLLPNSGFIGCPAGEIQIAASNNTYGSFKSVCLKSSIWPSTHTLGDNLPNGLAYTSSSFIKFCARHKVIALDAQTIRCSQCITGYLPSEDETQCVQSELANCSRAFGLDGSKCSVCTKSYLRNSANSCLQPTLANCQTLSAAQTLTNSTVKCQTCNDSYYLNGDLTCTKGSLLKCLQYSSENICTKCSDGYVPHCVGEDCSGSNPLITCIKNVIPNCQKLKTELSSSIYNTQCTQCDLHFIRQDTTLNVQASTFSFCEKHEYAINKCKSYDLYKTSVSTRVQCNECEITHYLNSNFECIQRTYPSIQYCSNYSIGQDKCATCQDGYYISLDNLSCIVYPTGPLGCRVYDDSLNCVSCSSTTYLDSNKVCQNVTTPVTQCMTYKSATECSVCNAGHFLAANKCDALVSIDQTSCLEIEAKDSCKTCRENYSKTVTNGKGTCTNQSSWDVNCDKIDVTVPTALKCLQCKQNYYIGTATPFKCLLASPLISDCLLYSSNTLCQKCSPGKSLAVDKKSCVMNTQTHPVACADQQQNEDLTCTMCAFGSQFVNGVCSKNSKSTIESGCFDENADGSCFYCISGYTMGADGKCTNNNPPPPPPPGSSVQIVRIFQMLILLVLAQ